MIIMIIIELVATNAYLKACLCWHHITHSQCAGNTLSFQEAAGRVPEAPHQDLLFYHTPKI